MVYAIDRNGISSTDGGVTPVTSYDTIASYSSAK